MRILHIAPLNTAGVPMAFTRAERALGHESRLVTFSRSSQSREEDICLDLPFLDFWGTRWMKKMVTPPQRRKVKHIAHVPEDIPIQWKPGNPIEKALIQFREMVWRKQIEVLFKKIDFWDFEVYQLDGGLGFYRDGRIIRRLKEMGKKIICCYTGSDLRTRGVIPEIDRISDVNVTVEYDHLRFHPDIHHVPFPLDISQFSPAVHNEDDIIRIGHAPTHRAAKGSDIIIPIVKKLESIFPVRLVLIENLPYKQALKQKSTCHIFIDQIGNLGYGINGIEALMMGIPTCSSLAPGFEKAYPDHPFFEINEDNLESTLTLLIQDDEFRKEKGKEGAKWVKAIHDPVSVVQKIHHLAGLV